MFEKNSNLSNTEAMKRFNEMFPMILNIKILPFVDLREIKDRSLNIYKFYKKKGNIFKNFIEYFNKNFMKSHKYSK